MVISVTSSFISWVKANRKGWPLVIVVTLVGTGWAVIWKYVWTNPTPANKVVGDPSVVIGTFITLYGLFIGGFGVLVGLVMNAKHEKEVWKFAAILLLIEATAMDLWRVFDSTNDLYNAATNGLSSRALHDTTHDFFAYFVLNAFVVAVAVAACMPPRSQGNPPAIPLRSGVCKP
jgi:hypothetical protein